jgi:hypothetical protein
MRIYQDRDSKHFFQNPFSENMRGRAAGDDFTFL